MTSDRRPWWLFTLAVIVVHTGWQAWQIASAPYPARYDYDEGVYVETAAAAARGLGLYTPVFLSQPPVLPLVLGAAFRVTGPSLTTARAVIVACSFFWLLSLFALLAAAGRPRAGAFAVLALVGNPTFLTAAHTVQMEAPSEALAAGAVALAVFARRLPRVVWWGAAGALWGVALMTKFTAVVSLAPLVVAALVKSAPRESAASRKGRLGGLAVGGAGAIALVLPVRTLAPFVDQALLFHVTAVHTFGFDPVRRSHVVAEFLAAGSLLLAGAALGVRRPLTDGGPVQPMLVAWFAAALAAVLVLTPPWPHHLAILLSPLSLLAGSALDLLVNRTVEPVRGAVMRSGLMAGVAAYSLAGAVTSGLPASSADLRDASARVAQVLPRQAAVLTDDPMVAVLADRPVPPGVIDTSLARLRAGHFSEMDLAAALRDDRTCAALLWRGTFAREFPHFASEAALLFPVEEKLGGGRVLLHRNNRVGDLRDRPARCLGGDRAPVDIASGRTRRLRMTSLMQPRPA